MGGKPGRALIERLFEDETCLIQCAAHSDVLRALSGEQERHARASKIIVDPDAETRMRLRVPERQQGVTYLDRGCADGGEAMIEMGSPGIRAEANIGQRWFVRQPVGISDSQIAKRSALAGGKRQDVQRPIRDRGGRRGRLGRFLDQDVRVRAAEAE